MDLVSEKEQIERKGPRDYLTYRMCYGTCYDTIGCIQTPDAAFYSLCGSSNFQQTKTPYSLSYSKFSLNYSKLSKGARPIRRSHLNPHLNPQAIRQGCQVPI